MEFIERTITVFRCGDDEAFRFEDDADHLRQCDVIIYHQDMCCHNHNSVTKWTIFTVDPLSTSVPFVALTVVKNRIVHDFMARLKTITALTLMSKESDHE